MNYSNGCFVFYTSNEWFLKILGSDQKYEDYHTLEAHNINVAINKDWILLTRANFAFNANSGLTARCKSCVYIIHNIRNGCNEALPNAHQ